MRKALQKRVSKIEKKKIDTQIKMYVLADKGIVTAPHNLKGKNINELNENEYWIINMVSA